MGGGTLTFDSLPLFFYKGFMLERLPAFTGGFMLESLDVLLIEDWLIDDNLELLTKIGLMLDRLA